jgi:hypothetical protein
MIDFDKMDSKKISLLCRHPENISGLVEFLKGKQLEVFVCKNSAEFFQSLSLNKPGFAMISNDVNNSMGRIFPNFIQRKFKIPVLLFSDEQNRAAKETMEKPHSNAAVRALHQTNPEHVHDEIVKFKHNYEAEVSKLAKSQGVAPGQDLTQQRLQRQTQLLGYLRQKFGANEADKQSTVSSKIDQLESISISTVKIHDPEGQGCFLFATAIPADENKESLKKSLQESLQMLGEKELVVESIEGCVNNEFYQRLKNNSDKTLLGHFGKEEVCVLYYENAQVNNWDEISMNEEGYLVPVDEWWSKMPLNFNACIWLAENSKRILYMKKGTVFPESSMLRFKERDQKILVLNQEFQDFQHMAELASMLG